MAAFYDTSYQGKIDEKKLAKKTKYFIKSAPGLLVGNLFECWPGRMGEKNEGCVLEDAVEETSYGRRYE